MAIIVELIKELNNENNIYQHQLIKYKLDFLDNFLIKLIEEVSVMPG